MKRRKTTARANDPEISGGRGCSPPVCKAGRRNRPLRRSQRKGCGVSAFETVKRRKPGAASLAGGKWLDGIAFRWLARKGRSKARRPLPEGLVEKECGVSAFEIVKRRRLGRRAWPEENGCRAWLSASPAAERASFRGRGCKSSFPALAAWARFGKRGFPASPGLAPRLMGWRRRALTWISAAAVKWRCERWRMAFRSALPATTASF